MKQKGRPKNSKNKQKEYQLPIGVSYNIETLPERFDKSTKLEFIDSTFGNFTSTIHNLDRAGGSTHPSAVQKRREETNLLKYGGVNPHCSPDVRAKFKKTMINTYGEEHALNVPEFYEKSKNTLISNYGVTNPVESSEIRKKMDDTLFANHGVHNPMKSAAIKEILKKSNKEKYGVENPFQSSIVRERFFKTAAANGTLGKSKAEQEIREYVQSLGLEAPSSYLGGAEPRQLDIKIKEKNIAIEYNGLYWHSEANSNIYPNYHLDKTNKAKEQGLQLIHIFEHEWTNKKEQVKSFLRAKLDKNTNKIYARKCVIKEVDKKEARDFLNKYHILGACNFIKAFGLYYEGILLSLVTIAKHHRNNKDIVLNRFVGKTDYTVIGGLSKLCSAAYKEFGEFITWVDYRFSNGENWVKCGWTLEKILEPDYFYYNTNNRHVISKQMRSKKNAKTPAGVTEHQHALNDGLCRVYDCGKIRLRFKGK